MKIDRRIIKNFDWITLTIIIILSIAGILTIYSATRSPITNETPGFYMKQIYWLAISIIALVAVTGFDYSWLRRFSYPVYGLGLLLLLIVLIVGKTGMGAQRWLNLGFLSFQPSEVFKVFLVLALSRYLEEINTQLNMTALLKVLFTLIVLPFFLIFKQPDLGTSVIILAVFLTLVAMKGLEKKAATLIIIIGIVSIPFLGNIMWENLKVYQKNRIVAFMEPEVDPSGIGYHINQSKIAIGSGKIFGKGYLKGTQGPFRFLPEKHTDFIYAV
ncbi:MAG: FtsW/RodA/SpoVE family cell cycle protein, partial [Thermodesulfovibrionales bacterium]